MTITPFEIEGNIYKAVGVMKQNEKFYYCIMNMNTKKWKYMEDKAAHAFVAKGKLLPNSEFAEKYVDLPNNKPVNGKKRK